MTDPKMVVVDGVRYRPEHAPESARGGADAPAKPARKARRPKNKARTDMPDKGTEPDEDTPTDE